MLPLAMAVAVLIFLFSGSPTSARPPERVTHYALVVTGPAFDRGLDAKYWAVNQQTQQVLTHYGYPAEAVYRFCDQGVTRGPGVAGRSTLANLRRVLKHLAKVLVEKDHLFLFLIGHGSPSRGDFVYVLGDGRLSATELKGLVDALPTRTLTIILHPCFSGGFIPKLSRPGRVICTSTSDSEVNRVPWAEAFVAALLPTNKGGRDKPPSIKQAYNAALEVPVRHYGRNLQEHPLLDDNGDGVGHFGKTDVVGGDGALAARRFLGDEGRKLSFSPAALQRLARLNAGLSLTDLARLQEVFAAESAFLGGLGGYADPGARSTRKEDHLAWARKQSAHVVAENLVKKYLFQFDRQARLGKASADRFYADASARFASWGIDLGDRGANLREAQPHLQWARKQTVARLREEIEQKLRVLLAGASDRRK
jgi:hypothetical protein